MFKKGNGYVHATMHICAIRCIHIKILELCSSFLMLPVIETKEHPLN